MSLPAAARRRWGLEGGGRIGFLDIGDAVVLIPSSADELLADALEQVSDREWDAARAGFGDAGLATE